MTERKPVNAFEAPLRDKLSSYPEPFASRMAGRTKRPLGDLYGLQNFGVNLTTLTPGSVSSLHHTHSQQDEFIYIVDGNPTLFVGEDVYDLEPGMVFGFSAGGDAHHLENKTNENVTFLEIGDRSQHDKVSYPHDDLKAELSETGWVFMRKNGDFY